MSKHTLEQVLEALINKEDDRASELLHQFFVAKGKQIYEELSSLDEEIVEEDDSEEVEESIGGDVAEDFEEEIVASDDDIENERLFSEDEDMGDEDPMSAEEPSEDEATAELAMDVDAGEEAAAPDAEEAMANVEDALADLKAAFAEIMGEPASDDMPADMGAEEEVEEEFAAIGESASLSAVAAPTHGDDGQNTKSPVASSKRVDGNGAAAVKVHDGNTAGGKAAAPKQDNMGNVNVPGNKKAPALKSVAAPKGSDSASNKTSPVAKA